MLKESRYVRLASTMYRVLRNSRIPLFLHRKSNHVFTMWQHIALLTIRQHQGKSYNRRLVEWMVEAYYLRLFLQLSRIPHFTTLQRFTEIISNALVEKIISSFIVISGTKHVFVGIDKFNRIKDNMLHSIILNG